MSATNFNYFEVFDVNQPHWRRSTRSGGNGNCVEAAAQLDAIAVRDSKLPTEGDFPILRISSANWAGMVTEIRAGNLDS